MIDLDALKKCETSRRSFLSVMGAAGVGLAATNLLAGNFTTFARAGSSNLKYSQAKADFPGIPGGTINEIVLNYALTLEILEADLYRQALNAASGIRLAAPLASSSSSYSRKVGTGGLTTAKANVGYLYLVQFAYVEAAHRDFLRAAITASGGTPVTANAGGYGFPGGTPGSDIKSILTRILPLEETGVRAYLGALPYLTDLNLGVTAGGIYTTEARHSAAVRYILGEDTGPVKQSGDLQVTSKQVLGDEFEYALAPSTVISAVGAYFQ